MLLADEKQFHNALYFEKKKNRKKSETPEGKNYLATKFKLCANLTKPEELTDYLTDVYGNLAMVNYPYNTSFLAPLPANPITEFCARINGTYNDDQLLDVSQIYQAESSKT